jgi:hypothetical protein
MKRQKMTMKNPQSPTETEGFLMVYTERGHEVAESKYCGGWILVSAFGLNQMSRFS